MTERQTFSAEFKREAVRLLESGDRKAAALARDLRRDPGTVYLIDIPLEPPSK
ncbi:hypothetical protein [Salinisphaera shabanensis]|uniref:hypothetical protein n=1 Tax=Salinisphaera shabanensis TaxID=180542 RepID=UPI00333E9F6C